MATKKKRPEMVTCSLHGEIENRCEAVKLGRSGWRATPTKEDRCKSPATYCRPANRRSPFDYRLPKDKSAHVCGTHRGSERYDGCTTLDYAKTQAGHKDESSRRTKAHDSLAFAVRITLMKQGSLPEPRSSLLNREKDHPGRYLIEDAINKAINIIEPEKDSTVANVCIQLDAEVTKLELKISEFQTQKSAVQQARSHLLTPEAQKMVVKQRQGYITRRDKEADDDD